MKKMTEETALKKAAKQLLDIHRIPTWAITQGLGSIPGLPDRIGVFTGGLFLGIEFKAGNRKLTEHQIRIKNRIEKAGGIYIVCRSVEDLQRELELPGLFV